MNLNTVDKIHFKCDVRQSSVNNGSRQPILFSFVLDKPTGYKMFLQPETLQLKKSVFNTIPFYLEDDNHEKIDFNGETLTFTLQFIRI